MRFNYVLFKWRIRQKRRRGNLALEWNWTDRERRDLEEQGIDPDLLALTLATDKNALFSVFDKRDSEVFAAYLQKNGWNIIASGGTATYLEKHGIQVISYSSIYGSGEMLGGRVKTIGRGKSAGLISKSEQREELAANNWPWLEVYCGNFYDVQGEIAKPDHTEESVIESSDVGGPTSALEASKGRRIVVSSPDEVDVTIKLMEQGRANGKVVRRLMAKKAYGRVKDHVAALEEFCGEDGVEFEDLLLAA